MVSWGFTLLVPRHGADAEQMAGRRFTCRVTVVGQTSKFDRFSFNFGIGLFCCGVSGDPRSNLDLDRKI